ncbi:amino acid adenylation domain-containing protein [Streptomyces sp. bgisy031]|uniref:amino acid adenylation domain-containing protein n=1 Tax=Streptomyces sp. bgisy031 TaxID=3413772 RepID=UPI003D74F2AA
MSQPRTLYGWFARSARRLGDTHTALEVGDEQLSYAALQNLAERLAGRLTEAAGDTPPRRVGLLASRSVTAYAGFLAALRTGAAVVPLHPDAPTARNADVAQAAGVDLVLADEAGADPNLGEAIGVPVLAEAVGGENGPKTTGTADEIAGSRVRQRRPAAPFGSGVGGSEDDDVAYIIFTSGSTGRPKGVPTLHRNICAYLSQAVPYSGAGPGSRMSQAFELTFDGAVHDLFVAWASGATLVVPTRGQLLSPVSFINARRITHWFSVPSAISFAIHLGTLEPGAMPTLRHSTFGGEPLPLDAARRWQRAAPAGRLENLYGPTELTVACTRYRLPPDPADWPRTPNGTVPIGACLPAVEHLLLDDDDGGPGTVGELCLRGPQRFPGYLDPADNTDRFVRLDAAGARGARFLGDPTDADWYCSGDRVTHHDGHLVHLGRTDQQVKIRGHRIELGEIESALRELPGVREAVALEARVSDGERELFAAVSGTAVEAELLYAALGRRLPSYMLPRRITVLERLPLSRNGKIDRRALQAELTSRQHP